MAGRRPSKPPPPPTHAHGGSIWLGVRQAFATLADTRVPATVTPRDGETFDPADFIRERGSLYVL